LVTAVVVAILIAIASLTGGAILNAIVVLGGWLYYAAMESSSAQATLGKLALGVKVTDLTGNRIGFGRATGRYFAKIISGLALGIGYVMVAFTQRRQGLHDMIAGTLVVRRPLEPEAIAGAGPAPHVSGGLIALTVIGAIFFGPFGIGMMAAIAIPAYQNYTVRAQITEGLSLADGYKTAVSEAIANGQDASTISSETLRLPRSTEAKYVDSIQVGSGIIVIEYGRSANKAIAGKSLLIAPGMNSTGGSIIWVCGRATPPPDVKMVRNGLRDYTTVPIQFLPTACHE
jgi:Tfp pilus assembly major pilin PilA